MGATKVLIKTLCGENSSVYTIAEGNRIRLADCQVKIELYEYSQRIGILGVPGGRIKQTHSSIVICLELDTTREVSAEFLRKVSRFEIVSDIQRKDGIFERIKFDSITPVEIDLHGDWTFNIVGSHEIIKKLLTF